MKKWHSQLNLRQTILIVFLCIASASHATKLDSLKEALDSPRDSVDRFGIYMQLSDAYISQNNDSALAYAQKAYEVALQDNDTASMAWSLVVIGEVQSVLEMFSQALSSCVRAVEFSTIAKDTVRMADAYGALGGLYGSLFDHNRALKNFNKAIELARSIEHVWMTAKNMNNLGNVFAIQGEYNLALKTFLSCIDILENSEWSEMRATSVMYMNAGMICNDLGMQDSSVLFLKKAMKGFKRHNSDELHSNALIGLVSSFTSKGQLDSAMYYYQKSHEFLPPTDNSKKLNYKNETYANLLFAQKRYHAAIDQALRTYERTRKDSNQTFFAENASKLLYQAYKEVGDLSMSLKFMEAYLELHDQMKDSKNREEVRMMRVLFETELDFESRESELKDLQLKQAVQKNEILKQKGWRNVILVFSILGALISFLILNRFKLKAKASDALQLQLSSEKEKLKMEVEHKNRELTSASMFVAQKNQMLMELQDHLSKIADSKEEISPGELRSLRNEVKSNIQLDEDWDRIKLHFEEVYPQYFQRIKEKHPELTKLELKHCAYLRMNMSVKEVARMLSVAAKSVQMSHYRLKKKLGLGSEDSLSGYLSKF